jgi:hypothetical protein
MEAMLSEFDYFTPTILQTSIDAEYDDQISTVNAINATGDDLGAFEFNIPGANNLYRDLNNSYLMLKVKVTTANGGNLANNAAIAPANLALHSMFSNVSVTLCGKEITEKDSMYAYRSYMETLLTFDKDVLKTRCAAEGWVKDEVGRMNNVTMAVQQNQPDPNSGFVARQKLIDTSRVLTLVGRPHLDLFHQQLDIPPGCPITIRFTAAPFAFSFIGDAALNTSKVVLQSAFLYIRTKRVCPELVLSHKEMLEKSNIRIPHNRVTVARYGIPNQFTSKQIPLNFPAKLPKRIFIGFVSNAACTGSFAENPFNFQNFGLTELFITVNGNSIPADGMKVNYTTGDFQRAYLNLLAALGIDNGGRSIALAPDDFKQGYNIYGFKIAPGPIDGTVFTSANSIGSLAVHMSWAVALVNPIDMIVFAETPAILEIDQLSAATLV